MWMSLTLEEIIVLLIDHLDDILEQVKYHSPQRDNTT